MTLKAKPAEWRSGEFTPLRSEITSDPAFPPNFRPVSLRTCLYASMVACSLLGGPDLPNKGSRLTVRFQVKNSQGSKSTFASILLNRETDEAIVKGIEQKISLIC